MASPLLLSALYTVLSGPQPSALGSVDPAQAVRGLRTAAGGDESEANAQGQVADPGTGQKLRSHLKGTLGQPPGCGNCGPCGVHREDHLCSLSSPWGLPGWVGGPAAPPIPATADTP